jgi:hypothetical protein
MGEDHVRHTHTWFPQILAADGGLNWIGTELRLGMPAWIRGDKTGSAGNENC